MLTINFKTTFSLIAYTLLFNMLCFTVNIISIEYAQIGYISTYIILAFQLLILPIYFYFIGRILEKLQFKQLILFMIISVIIGITLILFSFNYYASASIVDWYIQGLVCSLFPIGILIDQWLYLETGSLYAIVAIVIFLLEIIYKIIFIKIGTNQGTVLWLTKQGGG